MHSLQRDRLLGKHGPAHVGHSVELGNGADRTCDYEGVCRVI